VEMSGVIFFVIVVAVIVLTVAYFSHLAAKRRREELAALAASLGWRFDPNKDRSHEQEYNQFAIFRQGHSKFAFNTLTGIIEIHGQTCRAKMGDYHYQVTTSDGKNSTTHTYLFSYLIIHLPYPDLPGLLIRREGMFDRLKSFLGFPDINFESAEFSRKFYVQSCDKRFAYDVIHPGMIEFLMQSDAPTIDIEHGQCCLAEDRKTWTPEEFRKELDWAREFFDLWPSHLTQSLAELNR